MLKIKRTPGQSFYIGETRVIVEHVGERQVTLAIDSPPEVIVYREEVFERIRAEKMTAA